MVKELVIYPERQVENYIQVITAAISQHQWDIIPLNNSDQQAVSTRQNT